MKSWSLGFAEAAMQEFQLAIAQEPENGQGYLAIGQVLAREQLYLEAEAWFDSFVKLNPESRWWLIEQANNFRDAGDLSDGLILYTEILQNYSDWAQVYYEIDWAYSLDNHHDEAVGAIEIAIVLQKPQRYWYYWRAGLIYEKADQSEASLNAYKQALFLSPDKQSIRDTIDSLTKNEP